MLILAPCLKISADKNEGLATPADEKFSFPGCSVASATNSFSVLGGKSVGTIATSGTEAMTVTPAKSFTGSNWMPLLTTPAIVWPFDVSINVEPSGALCATPVVPGRPGRFSTTTDCFHMVPSLSASTRAMLSVMLPAPNGATMCTVREGQDCATAPEARN